MTSSDETSFDDDVHDGFRARVGNYYEGSTDGVGLRVGIVCARFNGAITSRLLTGALEALDASGVGRSDVSVVWVPGAFEIPLLAQALVHAASEVDVVITLGAVIRGETGHYEVVAGECARGVQDVQLRSGVPVIFGVLTVNTVEQALARSLADETNKGREAALTAIEMVRALREGFVVPK
jgi:6,7-dimethyl-8-ribityllumazine synthase